jgi:predicted negative regulator of RcsB-dependent stress response
MMIEDPNNWHNWNEKLGVVALIFGGIIGFIAFVWNWFFLKVFARHKDLQGCYDKVLAAASARDKENRTAHTRIEEKIDDLKDWLLKNK